MLNTWIVVVFLMCAIALAIGNLVGLFLDRPWAIGRRSRALYQLSPLFARLLQGVASCVILIVLVVCLWKISRILLGGGTGHVP